MNSLLPNTESPIREGREGGAVIWFTGFSGSGKTTLARSLAIRLNSDNVKNYVLDGDNLRSGLCSDLGFSHEDRFENLRRASEVAKILVENGVVVLATFISPFSKGRTLIRNCFAEKDFYEVYCSCPLEVCEARDVKGLYKKARKGEIENFTGISSVYEAPSAPDIAVYTNEETIGQSTDRLLAFVTDNVLQRDVQF